MGVLTLKEDADQTQTWNKENVIDVLRVMVSQSIELFFFF